MKVLLTIPGLSAKSGGPSTCTFDLMEGLHDIGAQAELLTVSSPDILGKGRPWLTEVPDDCRTQLGFSRNLCEALRGSCYDLYHANALWVYSTHATCRTARCKGRPYVLSPHGMLYPTALAMKRWKKVPMMWLWFRRDIHAAACLHATCRQEAEYCRRFGYEGPIAVIPNPVVFPEGVELKHEVARTDGRIQIGFLGRLHPIKKVENIIYAIGLLPEDVRKRLSLQIMGKYDEAYEQWLRGEVERLHLSECVEFVGFVSGRDKYERLSRLTALMVPSAQENFGMIVPEALICGTPVYASLGTPWSELNDCRCGWWRDNRPETIASVITEILSKPDAELLDMGRRGRRLMEDKYEQHRVAAMMNRLYEWVAAEGMAEDGKPGFVV